MTTRKKPKHIPAFEFFRRLPLGGKISVGMLLILIAAAGFWASMAAADPTRWSVELSEVTNQEMREVKLAEVHQNYRTLSMTGEAWMQTASYAAGPIMPAQWPSIAFIIGLAIGVSFFLAGLTKVKAFVAAIGYGLVAFMFVLHGFSQSQTHYSIPVILFSTMALMGIASYLFMQEKLSWSVPARGFTYLAILGSGIGVAYFKGGWESIHSFELSLFPASFIMIIGWIILNGRELMNVIILAGTNSENPKFRLPVPVLLSICIMLLGLELVMLQDLFGWKLLPNLRDFPFRPMHLIVATALVTIVTSQNVWVKIKDGVPNAAYSIGLLGLTLAVVVSCAFYTSIGDYIFLVMIGRLAIAVFFTTGLFYLFYVVFNFRNSLGFKDNFYYLILMPKRLLYVFVMVAVILATIGLEASDGFKLRRFFLNEIANLKADREMVKGNYPEALEFYQISTYYIPGDVKGNYNQACILLTLSEDIGLAMEKFKAASGYFPFPLAAINKANLEMAEGHPWTARVTLSDMAARNFTTPVGNNLAMAWVAENNPDSAIYWLKRAIDFAPDMSTPASNLGMIYLKYNLLPEAQKFITAATQAADPGPVTITNALFYNLAVADSIPVDTAWVNLPAFNQEEAPQLNMAMWLMKRKQFGLARKICDSLLAHAETPSAMLLDGMLKFESGKFDLGYSRLQYLANFYPDYAPVAWHYLGFAFFKHNVPEMAAEYFRKAAAAGLTQDLLLEAAMEIDVGNHEYAYMQLITARGLDENLYLQVSKEIAMLQSARGFAVEAMLEWDMSDITTDERVRISRYAGQAGNLTAALENFRAMIEADPKTVIPYLEMGRIRLAKGDSLAADDLREGLRREPDNFALNCELARALVRTGDAAGAKSLIEKISKGHEKDVHIRLTLAEIALAKLDTAAAQIILKVLIEEDALNTEAILFTAEIYRAQHADFEGQVFISSAITLNNRNAEFHYYLALFEQALGRVDETANAAQKAMELRPDELSRNKRISEQFKEELKQVKQ
jgi:tetratricopeptide (TPR) repeat protein